MPPLATFAMSTPSGETYHILRGRNTIVRFTHATCLGRYWWADRTRQLSIPRRSITIDQQAIEVFKAHPNARFKIVGFTPLTGDVRYKLTDDYRRGHHISACCRRPGGQSPAEASPVKICLYLSSPGRPATANYQECQGAGDAAFSRRRYHFGTMKETGWQRIPCSASSPVWCVSA
jgi:hypothetical protein